MSDFISGQRDYSYDALGRLAFLINSSGEISNEEGIKTSLINLVLTLALINRFAPKWLARFCLRLCPRYYD
jgi:hypothetical protein